MSDLSFRTIMIAVGIFITMATVTGLVIYYNAAVDNSKGLSERTNIEASYSNKISLIFEKDILTGTDVRNIIRYYYLNKAYEINITEIKGVNTSAIALYKNVNNTWFVPDKKVISDYNMERINPSYNGKIVKNTLEVNVRVINIELS